MNITWRQNYSGLAAVDFCCLLVHFASPRLRFLQTAALCSCMLPLSCSPSSCCGFRGITFSCVKAVPHKLQVWSVICSQQCKLI